MPVTSYRGTLRDGESVYRQLTFWIAGGAPHSMHVVKLSPLTWQRLYGESHLLRGARAAPRGGRVSLFVPIAGVEFECVSSYGIRDDQFVVSDGFWDPSTGS